MGIDNAEALQIDLRAADRHASDYIVKLQNEITARGLILNGAIEDFNKFSQLPEKSGLAGAIWDAAFGVLSVAVPALKLAAFIEKQYKAAEIAINAAEAFGNKVKAGDRVKKAVTSAMQGAAKLVKTGDDVKGAVGKVRDLHKASQDVQSLCDHEARKPILDLIVELNNASALWSKAKAAVDAEWILRLDDQKRTGTLEDLMKSLLPPMPKVFKKDEKTDELNEVWTYYLYLLVSEFAKRNVKIVTTETVYIYDQGRPNQRFSNTEVEGLNNTQWDQLKAWFGPQAKRGELFKGRVFTGNRIEFARQLGASPETKKKMVDNGSWRRAKM